MAKILVVDDSWPNCQYLVKLLGYGNHQLLEAADGAEALDKVKAEHPDLIISDIFMPTMDGFEFVRRLRSDPTIADTPVVLYTATYHVSQVKDLADACGIHHVLEKPAKPEVILKVVEEALGNGPSPVQPLPPEQFEQERLRLLTGKLSERNEALGNRLAALIELNLELSAQRDLRLLLENFCRTAREIIGSKYAVASVSNGAETTPDIFTSGMDGDTASCFTGFTPAHNPLGKLLGERRPCFRADLKSASLTAELPLASLCVSSILGAPIVSPARFYGWLCLMDKIGAEQFSEEDERLAEILAAQVGRIYENGRLYEELQRHAVTLQREVAERERAEQALHERVSLAGLTADVGFALNRTGSLRDMLRPCAESMVRNLDAAFARIWTLNSKQNVLELQASAGLYTHLDGPHSRVPVGKFKIGLIAQEREPHLTNDVLSDPRVGDREWARREGMVAFAGYPLLVEQELVGVMAIFARKPLAETTLQAMAAVANQIALGIDRKKAEEAARGSEARKSAILRVSLDAIITMDHEGKIQGFNRAAEKTFGYLEVEVIGKPLAELIVPASLRQRHRQGLARYLATGESTILDKRLEMPAMRADGTEFSAELTITRIPVDGAPLFTAYLRDVTERKSAEQVIRDREERIRLLLNSTAEAIYGIDLQGNCTFSNHACARLLGYADPADLLGKNMHDLIHHTRGDGTSYPVQACRINQAFRRSEGTHVDDEVLWRADGTSFPAEYWSFPICRDTEVIGAVVTFIDITERRRDEAKLREQAAFLEKATDAILVRDLQDHITFWNPSAEKLYGWTALEALGKNGIELLFKEIPPALDSMCQTLIETGEWNGEVRHVTKGGKEMVVLSRWTLLRDKESQPQSVLVINTDITDKKKAEIQHLRAQRMESLGVLAGGIAHDLNNVLTPILMAIEFLKMKLPGPENKPLLNTLQDSAERGAAMVKQVLAFARGTEGEHVAVSLRNASKECQRMLEHTLPKSIRLEFSLPADLWLISADATQISQVLMNLCVNARDAMPHGGRLAVTAQNHTVDETYALMNPDAQPGPYVVLSVSDTGTGIPPEILEKIFDPFFTTKKQGEGTGLGLSAVLGIVKSHGGFVSVYSEVGEGTRFSVYLPATTTTPGEQRAQEHNSLPRGQGELILVVDDELAICEITKATLEMHGYRALTAGDGAEALAALMENRREIKLVLTDMSMPVMDGAATIRALRKIEPRLLIIAATGLTVGGQSDVVQAGGVQAFLRKPYTADKLLATLKEVLDQKSGAGHDSLRSTPNRDDRSGTCLASCPDVS